MRPGSGPPPPPPGPSTPKETDPRFLFDLTIDHPPVGIRMLTPAELAQAIADLTRVSPDLNRIPRPTKIENLGNDADQLRIRDVDHVRELLVVATQVAAAADMNAVVPCKDAVAGCSAAEVTALLRRAFHIPVTDALAQRYLGIYRKGRESPGGDHDLGRRALLQAVLFAPGFLYRTEAGDAAGRLTALELAAKLSFFFWGTAPDAQLKGLALDGTLLADGVYQAQVERLRRDPRAERQVLAFVSEWLGIDTLDLIGKADAAGLPSSLRADMLQEIRLLVSELVRSDLPLSHLMTARETWMVDTTAVLYGAPGVKGRTFQKTSLDGLYGRRGILTTPAVLAAHGKDSGRAPMQRGKFLVRELFCFEFAPEAGIAEMNLPPAGPGESFRDVFTGLETSGICGNCHKSLNAGFALDLFDQFGRRFSNDIAPEGEARGILKLPPYAPVAFSNPIEGIEGFAAHPALGRCFVTQAYRLAQGRLPGGRDERTLQDLEQAFRDSKQGVLQLLRDIARAETFRTVR